MSSCFHVFMSLCHFVIMSSCLHVFTSSCLIHLFSSGQSAHSNLSKESVHSLLNTVRRVYRLWKRNITGIATIVRNIINKLKFKKNYTLLKLIPVMTNNHCIHINNDCNDSIDYCDYHGSHETQCRYPAVYSHNRQNSGYSQVIQGTIVELLQSGCLGEE